ncbi:MAG: hypothetical protein AAB305_07485 [Candidatus Zixiibacteriota bacterium]
MKLAHLIRIQPARCHWVGHILQMAFVSLFVVISASNSAHSSSFNFRIQDYKPDTVIAKQWVIDAGWSALGVRDNESSILSYWEIPYRDDSRISSRDSHSVFIQSTWQNLRLTRNKVFAGKYAIRYTYDNTDRGDSSLCRNCAGENSLRTILNDPHTYAHNIALTVDFHLWRMVKRPIGFFASWGGELLGQEVWSEGYNSSNTYSIDSLNRQWRLREHSYGRRLSRYSGNALVRAGVTIGRQYEGKYASAVLYLLEELEKEGYLDHPPSAAEIHTLCDTALHYVNAYATDDRRHRVSLLSALTETLEHMHLLRGPATQTTYLIDDRWYNMTYDTRPFGFQARVGQQAIVTGDLSHGSGSEWTHIRYATTPIDSPKVTHVHQSTSRYENNNNTWNGADRIILATSVSVVYGLPLSSRWQWNTSLYATSGNITFDHPAPDVHRTIDRWWDNAEAELATGLEYHATPRTVYSADLSATMRRERSAYYSDMDDNGEGLLKGRTLRFLTSCNHWLVPAVALDMRLYADASHTSIHTQSRYSTYWNRNYGIAVGVTLRGGY